MKQHMIIGGIALAALLVAGVAFAEDRSGSDAQRGDGRPDTQEVQRTSTTTSGERDLEKQDEQQGEDQQNATSSEDRQGDGRKGGRERGDRNATSTEREHRDESATSSREEQDNESATSSDMTEGERQRESHRSEVAKAVQELLSVADREGGIGQEVRIIARAQEENHAKINDSLKKVEDRNAFAKFFFGPDQTEIDSAKQIVAQNEAQIKQLTDLKSRMATGTDQTLIDNQITLLQKVNAEASSTLSAHENSFSLFGWMFRIFGR